MGFDANDDNRIILAAYAYTGEAPKFLGTWSIDVEGNNSKLEDLEGSDIPVSVVGYRLAEDSVRDASEVEFEAKLAKEKEKIEEKQNKETEKFEKEIKGLEYERKMCQMDMETYLKIEQHRKEMKELRKISKPTNGLTGTN